MSDNKFGSMINYRCTNRQTVHIMKIPKLDIPIHGYINICQKLNKPGWILKHLLQCKVYINYSEACLN